MAEVEVSPENLRRVTGNLLALLRELNVVTLVDEFYLGRGNNAPAKLLTNYMEEAQKQVSGLQPK